MRPDGLGMPEPRCERCGNRLTWFEVDKWQKTGAPRFGLPLPKTCDPCRWRAFGEEQDAGKGRKP